MRDSLGDPWSAITILTSHHLHHLSSPLMSTSPALLAFLFCHFFVLSLVAGQVNNAVITKGGVYNGIFWRSTITYSPAVLIKTTEEVFISNCRTESRGHHFQAGVDGVRVRIVNCTALGLNPNICGALPGRFFTGYKVASLELRNNYLEQTAGILIERFLYSPTNRATVKIINNQILNIDGRVSDGHGGWNTTQLTLQKVQFVQLNKVYNVPGMEIAWNQVINQPYKSRVEDNVHIYLSSGTTLSPLRIHNNFIRGAFPARPEAIAYNGGGILLGDGIALDSAVIPQNVDAYSNVVVGTNGYGMAVRAGRNILIHNNRVFSSGLIPNTSIPLLAQNVGIYIANLAFSLQFANNTAYRNVITWWRPLANSSNPMWLPGDAAGETAAYARNTALPGPYTLAMEDAEFELWKQRTITNNIKIGLLN